MKYLLYGFFAVILSPLLSFSVEPKNPVEACERFLNEKEKSDCLKKTQSNEIDWYASSLCEKIDNDKIFLSCFDSIQKGQYEPKAVDTCEKIGEEDESIKLKCLKAIKDRVVGTCVQSKSISSLEDCLKKQPLRRPASQNNFYQKK